jgi:hypothetical protein
MKTLYTFLTATTLSFSFLCAAPSFATSGEGRNGPDQSGISIPVQLDRRLTLDSFNKAIDICEAEANNSFFSQLMMTEGLKIAPFKKNDEYEYKNWYVFSVNGQKVVYYFQVGRNSSGSIKFVENNETDPNWKKIKVPEFKTTPEVQAMLTAAGKSFAKFDGGLVVNYETKDNSSYDQLGNLRQVEKLVTQYKVSASPITRYMPDSHRTFQTSLRLSSQDFNQCLQNNFR